DERGFELFISNLLEEQETLNKILRFNTEAINFIDSKNIGLDERKRNLEIESRDNRLILENSIQGSSVILSELGLVRENIAKIENLNEFLILNKNKMAEIYNEIQSLIVDINNIKNEIYENRVHVVNLLNESLNPYVKISLNNNIDIDDYLSILELSLKGSGMKYKELLPLVAERIPPAWLFYYVENKKYEDFAKVVGIQIDRAARLLSYLDDNNISDILVSQKEDVADFYLLDHGNYKPISELSIGQRCTVILSIIMENKNRILIVDQPEDHLDNEFIVKTLVNSIKRRSIYSQTILSSHNANIPVLGEAKNIINLDSNGRNGFIKLHGPVEEEPIKRVIESLMEGGKEAFEYRSKFYKE
ncbi:ATPases involved in DNA repair domain protein, partial [Acinetobacter baumannii 1202252]